MFGHFPLTKANLLSQQPPAVLFFHSVVLTGQYHVKKHVKVYSLEHRQRKVKRSKHLRTLEDTLKFEFLELLHVRSLKFQPVAMSVSMRNSSVYVTCSRFSFSLLRMSSTSSLAFSKSCRSFCQYLSASLAAETFSSTSGYKVKHIH